MKYLLLLSILIFSNQSTAAVIWPGDTAPCNTTLVACIDSIAFSEVIEIHTNGPIEESVITNKNISIIAGDGYSPVFASGERVSISDSGSSADLTISGLTFLAGGIAFNSSGPGASNKILNIRNNTIPFNSVQDHAIKVDNRTNLSLEVNIEYNRIIYNAPTSEIDRYGAINIINGSTTGFTSSGHISGRIYNNHITSRNDESIGIGYYEFSESTADLDISSNEFRGGSAGAILISKKQDALGDSRIDIAHNAFYNNDSEDLLRGIRSDVYDGELQLNVINNSVIDAHEGFNFQQAFGGIYDINFYNNLITQSRTPVSIQNPAVADTNPNITLDNDNNLFYNNELNDPDFIIGSNHISADPLITSPTNARLRPGSPAIESGNVGFLLFVATSPFVDADGLYRVKNGNPGSSGVAVDMGAYEAGDVRVLDLLRGNATNDNPIESEAISSDEFAKLQITQNWNANIAGGGFSNHNLGVYRAGFAWRIFTQNQTAMPANATFNVWKPAPNSNNFVHTASDAISASESFTELDRSGLNDNPDAILSVTQLWDGLYNDNPVGVFYNPFTDRWNIYNSNFVDMPWMAQFNVYYQEQSSNAFIHRVSDANSNLDATWIDHPLLNNTPCAQFQVTYDSGIVFENKTGVFYNPFLKQWNIITQDGEPMPQNARFHVIVSAEQIADCKDVIFVDDFE